MDAETFLVERDQIRLSLAEHRTALEVLHEDGREAKVLGMGLRDWTSLLMTALPVRGAWRWMPKSLMAFAAPMAVGYIRRKFGRNTSTLSNLLGFLRNSR